MGRPSLRDRLRCVRSHQLHPFATALRWVSVWLLLQSMALGWWADVETIVAWLLMGILCRLWAMDIDPRRTR